MTKHLLRILDVLAMAVLTLAAVTDAMLILFGLV
jgi:hypothetical protein